MFERTIGGDPDGLVPFLRETHAHLDQEGIEGKSRYAADLALEELVSNVLKYAGVAPDELRIAIRVVVEPGEICIRIDDNGVPFDPTQAARPAVSHTIQGTTVGGLGLEMVRALCDAMAYERSEETNRVAVQIQRTS